MKIVLALFIARIAERICNLAHRQLAQKPLAQKNKKKLKKLLIYQRALDTGEALDTLKKEGQLRLVVEGSPDVIQISFSGSEIVLGRRDPGNWYIT